MPVKREPFIQTAFMPFFLMTFPGALTKRLSISSSKQPTNFKPPTGVWKDRSNRHLEQLEAEVDFLRQHRGLDDQGIARRLGMPAGPSRGACSQEGLLPRLPQSSSRKLHRAETLACQTGAFRMWR